MKSQKANVFNHVCLSVAQGEGVLVQGPGPPSVPQCTGPPPGNVQTCPTWTSLSWSRIPKIPYMRMLTSEQ